MPTADLAFAASSRPPPMPTGESEYQEHGAQMEKSLSANVGVWKGHWDVQTKRWEAAQQSTEEVHRAKRVAGAQAAEQTRATLQGYVHEGAGPRDETVVELGPQRDTAEER